MEATPQNSIDGTWQLVRAELNGEIAHELLTANTVLELKSGTYTVRYADEGDWATREKAPADYGHRGWRWASLADGGGSSLELINPSLPNKHGQNWASSVTAEGTPGRVNSVAVPDIAPLILDVSHFPLVPKSADPVTITARVLDEQTENLAVTLHWRVDGATDFTAVPMTDDGSQGDGAPQDGVYGAFVPPHANDTIVEF